MGFSQRTILSPLITRLFGKWLGTTSLPPNTPPAELAQSAHGLGIPLTPVQKLILTLVGVSRGDENPLLDYWLSDDLKNLLGQSGEPERIWLPPDTQVESKKSGLTLSFKEPVRLLLCVAGRRSGKTTIASALMSWLIHRIFKDGKYLDGVPILPDSIVSVLNLACDTNQARILFRMLIDNLRRLKILDGKSGVDTARIGRVLVESLSSAAGSSRGRTACGIVLDEFAHFQRTSGPLSDRKVWTAMLPSLATFGNRGLMVVTTSPAGRSGVVWELFCQRGMRPGMLAIQAPTWVMNPLVPKDTLDAEFSRDENLARQEYGAEFIAPHGRFLKPEDIRNCMRKSIPEAPIGAVRHMHVDIGLVHDATAIAIGHIDRSHRDDAGDDCPLVVIERVETMEGSSDNPVPMSAVEKRIISLAREYQITEITFDQHESALIVENLKNAGLNARVFPATEKSNMDVFGLLRDLIVSGRIVLPDDERVASELETLECSMTSRGFKVDAMYGCHDDCADAVAYCAWCLSSGSVSQWQDFMEVIEEF